MNRVDVPIQGEAIIYSKKVFVPCMVKMWVFLLQNTEIIKERVIITNYHDKFLMNFF